MSRLRLCFLTASLLGAGGAWATGTGPTDPQTPQPPLDDGESREEMFQPDRVAPGLPQREGIEVQPRDSRDQQDSRQRGPDSEREAERDR